MASVTPRINSKGRITSWRVQARDERRKMRGLSFKQEEAARKFGRAVDRHGWWQAVALENSGEGALTKVPAMSQLDSVRGAVSGSTPDAWSRVGHFRAVMRDEISLALDWSDVRATT